MDQLVAHKKKKVAASGRYAEDEFLLLILVSVCYRNRFQQHEKRATMLQPHPLQLTPHRIGLAAPPAVPSADYANFRLNAGVSQKLLLPQLPHLWTCLPFWQILP